MNHDSSVYKKVSNDMISLKDKIRARRISNGSSADPIGPLSIKAHEEYERMTKK